MHSSQGVAGTVDTREHLIAAVKSAVEEDHRLVFAYLYGSLVRGEAFRDVDLGVYLQDPYWIISDSKLLSLVRKNISDCDAFIQAIQIYVSSRSG